MKTKAKELLRYFSIVMEFFIAALLCVAILYFTIQLAGGIFHLPSFPVYDSFEIILNTAFSLVIGIEMIRMMCEHSPAMVFEVLTFAIARQIVIDHSAAINNVYGMVSIAILFAIRKYLIPAGEEKKAAKRSAAPTAKKADSPDKPS